MGNKELIEKMQEAVKAKQDEYYSLETIKVCAEIAAQHFTPEWVSVDKDSMPIPLKGIVFETITGVMKLGYVRNYNSVWYFRELHRFDHDPSEVKQYAYFDLPHPPKSNNG